MNGVLDIEINEKIVLDEKVTKNMPDDIKTRLLATLTLGMERYDCDWTELTWKVEPSGIIKVKPKNLPKYPDDCKDCIKCHYGKMCAVTGKPFSELMCSHPSLGNATETERMEAVKNNKVKPK